jgi:lipopolysaccharide/colanic/teichoic acid biosynthesis glycosyltransferase
MPVTLQKSKREINMARARTGVTVLFFVCVALTIASLFTDVGPSFYKCAAATVILHFVRQSALQMSENSS